MYRKILIAYDGTAESRHVLHECVQIAGAIDTEVHLVVVITPPAYLFASEFAEAAAISATEGMDCVKTQMQQEIRQGHAFLTDSGLTVIDHLEVGEPSDIIQKLSNDLDVDLVIVGHARHKSLAMRWWRGSVDAFLLERLHCALMVAAAPH